jgi:hypothetical protein
MPNTTLEASFARWLDQLRPRRKIPSATKRTTPMNLLSGYRTYIVAAVMLLVGLAGLAGIDIPSFEGHPPASLVMEALAFFFLRKGLKTVPGTV